MAMNLGNLNNFIESYRGSADRARKIADENAQKEALGIAFQPLDTSLPPVAQTRGPLAPAAMPAQAAIPGAGGGMPPPGGAMPPAPAPAPGGANPAALAAIASLFGGGAHNPQAMAPNAPRPQPMPGGMSTMPQAPAPVAPPPSAGPALPQGGGADSGVSDPIKEATNWITSTFKGLKQQNPKASPYVLSLAVEKRIEAMKGLAPITKAAMQGQVEVMKNQTRAQQVLMKYEYDMQRAQTAEAVAKANAEYKQGMVEVYAGRTAEMETVGMDRNQATRDSAGIRAGATRDAAGIRAEAAKAVKGMAPGGRRDQAIIDGVAKISAAAAQTGGDPTEEINAFKREVSSVGSTSSAAPPARFNRSGAAPKPTPSDIAYAKAHPEARPRFLAHFGQAAAAALN